MNGPSNSGDIRMVDLSAFSTDADPTERQAAAKQLGEAAAKHGCAAIIGHGIPLERLHEAFGLVKRFYGMSGEDKMKAPRPNEVMHHRGYSMPGREKVAGKESLESEDADAKEQLKHIADYKETYEIGSERNEAQKNIWPPDDVLPGFQPFMTSFYWELHQAALRVLDALMLALDLLSAEQDALRAMHTGHFSQMRLAHYLPVSESVAQDDKTFRLAAHKDFGSFTILFQDGEHSGLEFQDPSTGDWMPAPPTDGVMYLNIADIFDRLSNGRFPSSNHRVTAPLRDNSRGSAPSRYSIVYFAAPESTEIVSPQSSLVEKAGRRAYDPITFGDYCMKMMAATQVAEKA